MTRGTIVGDILMMLFAMALGGAVNVAAFVYVVDKYVHVIPVVVPVEDESCKQQSTPDLGKQPRRQMMGSHT